MTFMSFYRNARDTDRSRRCLSQKDTMPSEILKENYTWVYSDHRKHSTDKKCIKSLIYQRDNLPEFHFLKDCILIKTNLLLYHCIDP
jgi:hypothetical protein